MVAYQTEGGGNTRLQDIKEGELVLGVRAIPPSGFHSTHPYEPSATGIRDNLKSCLGLETRFVG